MKKQNLLRVLSNELGVNVADIDPRKVIRTDKQFELKVMGEAMKKDQVKALSFTVDYNVFLNKYFCRVEVAGLSESRTVDTENCSTVLVRDKERIVSRERFTWQSVSVKLSEEVANKIGSLVFGSTIVVLYNKNGWVNVFVEKDLAQKTVYFNLEDGKDYASLPSDSNIYTIRKYRLDPVTASGTRNKSGVFRNVTEGDTRFEAFNKATVGGLRKQKEKIQNMLANVNTESELMEVKKTVKKAYGYLGNVATGSKNLGKVPGFHVYEGKWLNSTAESFLTDEFIELMEELNSAVASKASAEEIQVIQNRMNEIIERKDTLDNVATQDGQMYVNVIEFAKLIYTSTGYFVYPEVLLGRMLQIRPATIKASAVVVSPFVYKMMVKGSTELAESLGTKVTQYGDVDHSLFIADMNCIKLDFDMEEAFDFELLAFNKTSNGDASKQMYKNIIYAAKKQGQLNRCLELIRELENLTIDTKMAEAIDASKPAKMVSPNEVLSAMQSGFYTNVLSSIAPGFIRESKPLMESSWRQVINSVINDIDRMHGNIHVESRRLASDPTFILTGGRLKGILTLGKSFINDRKIDESVMFKYPVAGVEEQYQSSNTLIASIIKVAKKQVKNGVIENDHCEAIIQFFSDLKKTVRVLPALMFLANACAGLDFDYDGECSIIKVKNPKNRCQEISNEFVDILFNNGIRGVSISI